MANVRVSVEAARGCGFRKPGGIYLVTDGVGRTCGLLPVELAVCPACGHGVKPSRGWTWVQPDVLLNPRPHGDPGCPLEAPGGLGERAGLLWIGGGFYPTPGHWLREAETMGVSRRVKGVPKGFVVGETWVLAAHRDVPSGPLQVAVDGKPPTYPAVFHVFLPSRVEYVVRGDETDEELERLEGRGLSLVQVVRAEQQELEEVTS